MRLTGADRPEEFKSRTEALYDEEQQRAILAAAAVSWRRQLKLVGIFVRTAPADGRAAIRRREEEVDALLPQNPASPSELRESLSELLPRHPSLVDAFVSRLTDSVGAPGADQETVLALAAENGVETTHTEAIIRALQAPRTELARRVREGIEAMQQNELRVAAPEGLAPPPPKEKAREELLTYAFNKPLLFAPGTSFYYSNTNTVLLGLMVEKVSQQPLATYIKRHILRPLRLRHTSLPSGAPFPSPHAQGYTNLTLDCLDSAACDTFVNVTSWNISWAWAAGGMVSTVRDLHRWARAVATGKLLTRAAQKQRTRFMASDVKGVGYGLALADSNGWIGHNGIIFGYESTTIYLPSQRATVVVLTTRMT